MTAAMGGGDPISDLVFLARAAADAGQDWRVRLHQEWLPRVLAGAPHAVLVASLASWLSTMPAHDPELASQIESVVADAMAEQGYD